MGDERELAVRNQDYIDAAAQATVNPKSGTQ